MKELSVLRANLKISDTDFTDYTALYFINVAAFIKWKHCLNNEPLFKQHKANPWPSV